MKFQAAVPLALRIVALFSTMWARAASAAATWPIIAAKRKSISVIKALSRRPT
jgi:hypothetical protein